MGISTLLELLEQFGKLFAFLKKRRALLIVEDNRFDSEILGMFLTRLGYKFEIVDTAEAGIAMIETRHHHVVFTDNRLPMMTGTLFVERVRSLSPKTHVVVICAEPFDLTALQSGRYVGLIIKPVTLESIEDVMLKTK